MKRILPTLLCLFSFSTFAQLTTVQVMLKPGYTFGETTSITYCTTCSNDVGLNQIISSYAHQFQSTTIISENNLLYDYFLGIFYIDSLIAEAFVNDLNEYNTVVYNASVEQFEGAYNYGLYIRLTSITNGNFVSTDSNGLIVTSNTQLNSIFQQFNVNEYQLAFPGVTSLYNLFMIGCELCDTVNLKNAVEDLEGTVLVDDSTTNIPYSFLLNADDFGLKNSIQLFPNPTTGIFEVQIDSQFQDLDVELFDSNGRVIYKGKMNSIQNRSQTIDISLLAKGVYFLRIKNEELTHTKKIIKN